MDALHDLYKSQRDKERRELIQTIRELLNIGDCETAPDIETIAERVISAKPELQWLNDMGVQIGYVRSYKGKESKGKTILADCRKVTPVYGAYLPYDYIITVYEPSMCGLSDNHLKIVLWHELLHTGLTFNGELTVKPHDLEDFYGIIDKYGTRWLDGEVPDITSKEAETWQKGEPQT